LSETRSFVKSFRFQGAWYRFAFRLNGNRLGQEKRGRVSERAPSGESRVGTADEPVTRQPRPTSVVRRRRSQPRPHRNQRNNVAVVVLAGAAAAARSGAPRRRPRPTRRSSVAGHGLEVTASKTAHGLVSLLVCADLILLRTVACPLWSAV